MSGRKIFIRSGLLVGSVLLALAVAEAALRVAGYGQAMPLVQVDEQAGLAVSDGWLREDRELLWRLRRCDEYARRIHHVHPDNPPPPVPRGGRRVVCMGDSCTFLPHRNTPAYSLLLEGLFRPPGRRQVLNAALPGYSSAQGLAWLRSEVLALKPDLVTIYFGWNDHWRSMTLPDARCLERMELPSLRLWRLWNAWQPDRRGLGRGPERPFRVPLEEYRRNLAQMRRLTESAGVKCVFLTAPARRVPRADRELRANRLLAAGDDPMVLHANYNQAVRDLASGGAHVLDLADRFARHDQEASLLRDDGIHLTEAGLVLAAALLHEYINAHGLLQEP